MPVHDAAKCHAQQCHHHQAPLVPRDVPPPANGAEHPPHEVTRRVSGWWVTDEAWEWVLDEMATADCSVCGQPVMVKGRATHILCALARSQEDYSFPQAFIVGRGKDQP